MGRADTYSQPAAPDPVLPDAVVLELARAHLPAGRNVSRVLQVDESGGEARAYLLDASVVVKTQRPHRLRPRTSLAKEAALLRALADPLAGRIPAVYGYGRAESEAGPVEWTVMSRVPGRAAVLGEEQANRAAVLGELATVLHAVHALDPDDVDATLPTGQPVPRVGNGAALRRRLAASFADLLEDLDDQPGGSPLAEPLAGIVELALDALPLEFGQAPVVLHSNPGPTHTFINDSGLFSGLIDFGDAFVSHPALDLRAWPDPADRIRLREAYLEGRRPAPEWDAVWTVGMMQTDIAVLTSRPSLAEQALADLQLRIADL